MLTSTFRLVFCLFLFLEGYLSRVFKGLITDRSERVLASSFFRLAFCLFLFLAFRKLITVGVGAC